MAEETADEAANDLEPMVEIHTLVGRGSQFEGKLTFEGTVRIDGELSGEVFSDGILVVGEGGYVSAEVEVGSLIVEGTVEGNIVASQSVEIHTPGRVKGNITTPSLFIDRGVVFEGNCIMSEPDDHEYEDDDPYFVAEPPVSTKESPHKADDEADRGIGNVTAAGTIEPHSKD